MTPLKPETIEQTRVLRYMSDVFAYYKYNAELDVYQLNYVSLPTVIRSQKFVTFADVIASIPLELAEELAE